MNSNYLSLKESKQQAQSDDLNSQIQSVQNQIILLSKDLNDLKHQTDRLLSQKSDLTDQVNSSNAAIQKVKNESNQYMIKNEH